MANWWEAGGATGAVGIYEPVGAPDLASSYINRVTPGTNNAAPGVAPTFATATGQTYDGSTQWLDTGITPSSLAWTVLVRYSDLSVSGQHGACVARSSSSSWVGVYPSWDGNRLFTNGSFKFGSPSGTSASGVIGVAGPTGYFDDTIYATAIGGGSGAPAATFRIGKGAHGSAVTAYKIQAVAIFSVTLTHAQYIAVRAAMAALPDGGSWGASSARLLNHLRRMRSR